MINGSGTANAEKYTLEGNSLSLAGELSVDGSGLVVKYPGLFERTYIAESDYR
jgi:hypothetical protein